MQRIDCIPLLKKKNHFTNKNSVDVYYSLNFTIPKPNSKNSFDK